MASSQYGQSSGKPSANSEGLKQPVAQVVPPVTSALIAPPAQQAPGSYSLVYHPYQHEQLRQRVQSHPVAASSHPAYAYIPCYSPSGNAMASHPSPMYYTPSAMNPPGSLVLSQTPMPTHTTATASNIYNTVITSYGGYAPNGAAIGVKPVSQTSLPSPIAQPMQPPSSLTTEASGHIQTNPPPTKVRSLGTSDLSGEEKDNVPLAALVPGGVPGSSSAGSGERQKFYSQYKAFLQKRKQPIPRAPTLGFKQLDFYVLYSEVQKRGGLGNVVKRKLWKKIADCLELPPSCTDAGFRLKQHYVKFLWEFEKDQKQIADDEVTEDDKEISSRKGRLDVKEKKPEKKFERKSGKTEEEKDIIKKRKREDGGMLRLEMLAAAGDAIQAKRVRSGQETSITPPTRSDTENDRSSDESDDQMKSGIESESEQDSNEGNPSQSGRMKNVSIAMSMVSGSGSPNCSLECLNNMAGSASPNSSGNCSCQRRKKNRSGGKSTEPDTRGNVKERRSRSSSPNESAELKSVSDNLVGGVQRKLSEVKENEVHGMRMEEGNMKGDDRVETQGVMRGEQVNGHIERGSIHGNDSKRLNFANIEKGSIIKFLQKYDSSAAEKSYESLNCEPKQSLAQQMSDKFYSKASWSSTSLPAPSATSSPDQQQQQQHQQQQQQQRQQPQSIPTKQQSQMTELEEDEVNIIRNFMTKIRQHQEIQQSSSMTSSLDK